MSLLITGPARANAPDADADVVILGSLYVHVLYGEVVVGGGEGCRPGPGVVDLKRVAPRALGTCGTSLRCTKKGVVMRCPTGRQTTDDTTRIHGAAGGRGESWLIRSTFFWACFL